MSEFNAGKVAATHHIGHRVEDTKEAYEREIVGFDGMRAALVISIKALEDHCRQLRVDGEQSKITIKEADIGIKHVNSCIMALRVIANDTEAKRFAALGAAEALKRIVADVKSIWEDEQKKLQQIVKFEEDVPKDLKNRPIGYLPKEHPLELAQVGPKRRRKTPSSDE